MNLLLVLPTCSCCTSTDMSSHFTGKRGSEIATPPIYNQLHTMPEAPEYNNLVAQPDWHGDVDTRREERFTELDLSEEDLIEYLDNQ